MPFCEILEPGGVGAGSPALSSPRLPPRSQWLREEAPAFLPQAWGGQAGRPSPSLVFALHPSTPTLSHPRSWSFEHTDPTAAAAPIGALPPPSPASSLSHSKQTHHLHSSGLRTNNFMADRTQPGVGARRGSLLLNLGPFLRPTFTPSLSAPYSSAQQLRPLAPFLGRIRQQEVHVHSHYRALQKATHSNSSLSFSPKEGDSREVWQSPETPSGL